MTRSLSLRAAIVSIALFAVFIAAWHLATRSTGAVANMDPEYAKLMDSTQRNLNAAVVKQQTPKQAIDNIAKETQAVFKQAGYLKA